MQGDINPFYEAAINHMSIQLAWLEETVGRPLTDDEKDNLRKFVKSLHPRNQEEFEDRFGNVF